MGASGSFENLLGEVAKGQDALSADLDVHFFDVPKEHIWI
ncbi:hypothetical protein Leryth_003763, partial [Lithospermum erythrorhizon]